MNYVDVFKILIKGSEQQFLQKKHLIFTALFNKNAAQHRTICKKRLHYYRTLNHFRHVRYRTICHFLSHLHLTPDIWCRNI